MKTIKLSVEQAKELYNTNKEFRNTILHEFTDSELEIEIELREWEDLDFKGSYYAEYFGRIVNENRNYINGVINVPTEKHAKSMIAFAKLSMLKNDLGDECNVDWNDGKNKYVVYVAKNKTYTSTFHEMYHFLAFKTESIRNKFLKKHERLIKDYFMLD